MVDNKTPNLNLPLPDAGNRMKTEDLPRLIAAFTAIDSAIAARALSTDVATAIAAAIANRVTTSDLSAAIATRATPADVTTAVNAAITVLVGGAPAALNTLKELADAINDDASFAASVTAALATKANTSALAALALSGAWADITGKPTAFTPPIATSSVLGGVKVGAGLSIDGAGVLNAVGTVPAGVVSPFAGSAAPTGWLLCAGQAVSRTTYSDLFTAIGTTYGAGDGSTTFTLPDLRGRAVAGKDDMGGTAASRLTIGGSGVNGASLGAVGGAETHTLTIAQMPSHSHTIASNPTRNTVSGGSDNVAMGGASTISSNSQGSGNAHNNTQPTMVLNYIIKT